MALVTRYCPLIQKQGMFSVSDSFISNLEEWSNKFFQDWDHSHVLKFVSFTGVPDAPQAPVGKEIYKDTALISWIQPADGGKPITNYIVEKKETMANTWTRAGKDRIFPNTEYWVPDLLRGCEYEFRVMAENMIGVGDPSPPSKPVFAKDPIGTVLISEFFIQLCLGCKSF